LFRRALIVFAGKEIESYLGSMKKTPAFKAASVHTLPSINPKLELGLTCWSLSKPVGV